MTTEHHTGDEAAETGESFMSHLIELRERLLKAVGTVVVVAGTVTVVVTVLICLSVIVKSVMYAVSFGWIAVTFSIAIFWNVPQGVSAVIVFTRACQSCMK